MSGVANNVQGATIFSDNTVTGGPNDVVVRNLLVENNLTIDNNFIADAIIVDNVTVNNDLQVTGNINTIGNINADGTLTADNGLVIDGDSYMNGDVFVDNTVFATDASVNGTIIVGDNTPAPPAPGTLEVFTAYGDADISGTLTVNGSQVTGPGGTATGTVQYRSATGTLEGDDDFLIESAPKRLRITATTASTGPTSGSIVTAGGIGVAGTLYSNGVIRTLNNTVSTGTGSGSIITAGGIGVAGAANIGGAVKVLDNTASTSVNTGAAVISGGLGVAGQLTAGNLRSAGTLIIGPVAGTVENTQARISCTTLDPNVNGTTSGSSFNVLSLCGGAPGTRDWTLGIDGVNNNEMYLGASGAGGADPDFKWYYDTSGRYALLGNPTGAIAAPTALFTARGTSEFTGNMAITSTTASTSTTTGAEVIAGGLGVGGAINVGGSAKVFGNLVVGPSPPSENAQACINGGVLDNAVNGTTSGTAYNILEMVGGTRSWFFGTDGVTTTQFYLGNTGGTATDPDYKFYYDLDGRFAVLGNVVGAITAPTNLFTVRGTSEMTGAVSVNNTQDATTADGTSGALRTTGGLSVAKAAYVGTQLVAPSMVTATTGDAINIINSGIRYFGGSSRAIKIQRGAATSSTAPVTVTFANTFPGGTIGQEPIVTATMFSATALPNNYSVQIHTVTTTNFSFSVRHNNAYVSGIDINWIAMSSTI
jgi:hypothetical protein